MSDERHRQTFFPLTTEIHFEYRAVYALHSPTLLDTFLALFLFAFQPLNRPHTLPLHTCSCLRSPTTHLYAPEYSPPHSLWPLSNLSLLVHSCYPSSFRLPRVAFRVPSSPYSLISIIPTPTPHCIFHFSCLHQLFRYAKDNRCLQINSHTKKIPTVSEYEILELLIRIPGGRISVTRCFAGWITRKSSQSLAKARSTSSESESISSESISKKLTFFPV